VNMTATNARACKAESFADVAVFPNAPRSAPMRAAKQSKRVNSLRRHQTRVCNPAENSKWRQIFARHFNRMSKRFEPLGFKGSTQEKSASEIFRSG
jgi:hypothetical protein